MNTEPNSEKMTQAMQRARQHWKHILKHAAERQPDPDHPTVFCIAISREAGARAEEIARLLGQQLDWAVYDYELVEHIAREAGVRHELIQSLDERPASWFRQCGEAFLNLKAPTTEKYLKHLVQTLFSLATHGDCVIVGRGATAVLPTQTTLSVRLVAPRERRLQNIQADQGVSPAEAEELLKKTDQRRRDFIQKHFHKDSSDPKEYHLVLNVDLFPPQQCAKIIVEALEQLKAI